LFFETAFSFDKIAYNHSDLVAVKIITISIEKDTPQGVIHKPSPVSQKIDTFLTPKLALLRGFLFNSVVLFLGQN